MAIRKSIIASFLLLLFTAAQISVVHEFSHDEDSTECAICLVAQNFQTQSYDLSASVEFDSIALVSIKENIVVDLAFAKAESQSIIHTTRPPPFSMDTI
ncbi:MAG: hypothetical protein ACI9LF_001738 [Flavobacteriales bacterium]|jgi:hypothetical protein